MWKGIQIGTGAHCRQIPPGAARVEKESPGESQWEVVKAGNSMSMTAGAAVPSKGAEDKTRNREDGGPIVDNFSTLSSPTDWGGKEKMSAVSTREAQRFVVCSPSSVERVKFYLLFSLKKQNHSKWFKKVCGFQPVITIKVFHSEQLEYSKNAKNHFFYLWSGFIIPLHNK